MTFEYAWHDFVGNLGVLCVLGTYLALQLGRMSAESLVFSSLNALGAVLILVSLLVDFNLSSFIIEIAWLTISILGALRQLRRSALQQALPESGMTRPVPSDRRSDRRS